MNKHELLARLKGQLVVSVQAEDGFPLNQPDRIAALAGSVVMGGAQFLRISGPENIRAVQQVVSVPIIGIFKADYPDNDVRITPTLVELDALIETGVEAIALDGTPRRRPGVASLDALFAELRDRYEGLIMADISTLEEGRQAAEMGAHIVGSTLSGYTDYTPALAGPDFDLIRALSTGVDAAVMAEGRINTPDDVVAAFAAGADIVTVGSAITRPHLITARFVDAAARLGRRDPVVAVDIGGTKVASTLIDGANALHNRVQVPTPKLGSDVAQTVRKAVADQLAFTEEAVGAVAISTGGQIDRQGDIIGSTGMLEGWLGVPLRTELQEHFDLPTFVLNDGHAAALAEARLGAGQPYETVLCLTIGTGLGGGLVMGGQVHHGRAGLAGAIGQMVLTGTGFQGMVLEDVVSGPGLAALYTRYNDSSNSPDAAEIGQMAAQGDAVAADVICTMGETLGMGLSHALHTLAADVVVIGGSVAKIGAPLFDAVGVGLRRYGYSSSKDTPIVPAYFGVNAGLVGASLHARDRQK